MRYSELLAALDKCKGDGTWKAISEVSGVHYDTVARIARGDMSSPGIKVCERIADALAHIAPKAVQ